MYTTNREDIKMTDFKSMKLGKQAPKIDARTLKLKNYFLDTLPAPPAEADWTSGITDWGMMLNDSLGDCTIAGLGHAEQVWSAARKGVYTLPDAAILEKYQQWCGYDPADPNTDQGGIEVDVLNKWRKNSFWNHPLTIYADVDPANLDHVCQAINLFGGVYIGIALPITAQSQHVWHDAHDEDDSNTIPGSWGGHAVFVPKYTTNCDGKIVFTCITWGSLQDISEDFWLYNSPKYGAYIDEVHTLIAPEFLSLNSNTVPVGTSPAGFDLATLKTDLIAVSN